MRTCVGCRTRSPRSALLRIVLDATATRLVADEAARLPGRGAWVHPTPVCVDRALKRKALTRALRAGGPLDSQALAPWLDQPTSTGGLEPTTKPRTESRGKRVQRTMDTK